MDITENEFHVSWTGYEWAVVVDGQVVATGQTPVSAMIAAEVSIRRFPEADGAQTK